MIPPDVAKALQVGDPPSSGLSVDERRAFEQLRVLFAKRRTCAQLMATRPQTLYGLADSPVGLAAWMFNHGDGYDQPAAAMTSAVFGRTIYGHPANGHPAGDLNRNCPGRWTVTFSNPPINMFVPTTIVELGSLMTDLEADPSVKVVMHCAAHFVSDGE